MYIGREMSSKNAERDPNAIYRQFSSTVFTDEELEEYQKCLLSKKESSGFFSLLGGLIASVTVPVKAETRAKIYAKRGMIGFGTTVFLSILSTAQIIRNCKPILEKAIQSRLEAEQSPSTQVDDEVRGTKDTSDFSLSSSFHDTGNFNFAVDLDSSTGNQNRNESPEELRQSNVAPRKRVTYDELWRQHRENSQARYQRQDSASEGIGAEVEAGDEPVLRKKKIRTNKYGDPLE